MPTGCYDNVHDCDVGVIVRLELDVITSGFGINVKRAEVAASDQCAGKANCESEARLSDSRVGKLTRCRRVSACERSGGDGHHSHEDSMRAKPSCEHHIVLLAEQKPDRFQTHSRHSARCARFSLPAVLAENMMTATAHLSLRLSSAAPQTSRTACTPLQHQRPPAGRRLRSSRLSSWSSRCASASEAQRADEASRSGGRGADHPLLCASIRTQAIDHLPISPAR